MQKNTNWDVELEIIASIFNKLPLVKTIKWGAEVFTYNGNNVVSYGGFKNFFSIWFFNGVFLSDKYNVLVNAQEGKTKSLRQWRFKSKDEIDEKKILEYIHEAIEIEKNGMKIKPQKFTPLPIPQLLNDELEKDKVLKSAFENFSQGKQKEFIVYINEAKQDATKVKRIEKIKPMIIHGIGLNDKYK